jgi:hypothetical protein
MRKFDGKNHDNNRFKERDENLGNPGSILDANWLNAMQDEVVNTIEALGITIDPNNPKQLKEAIVLMDSIPKLHVYEENARKYADTLAGDGFVEWGYHLNYADKSRVAVNNGAWTWDGMSATDANTVTTIRNQIGMGIKGIADSVTIHGNSNTTYPILSCGGRKIYFVGSIDQNRFDLNSTGLDVAIPLPDAPNGKEAIDLDTTEYREFTTQLEAKAWVNVNPTRRQLITERQDFIGMEMWYEEILEKDIVYPLGNVQYSKNIYNGKNSNGTSIGNESNITPISLDNTLVNQQYSAYGNWDTKTKGYGVKWSTLSVSDRLRFIQDSRNNIFFDSVNSKLIQLRYRVRVIKGIFNGDWSFFNGLTSTVNTGIFTGIKTVNDIGSILNPVTNKKYEIEAVAKHSGLSLDDVSRIHDHIFVRMHLLHEGSQVSTFDADYYMAHSWRRLRDGKNIQKHDITMLKHELAEEKIMGKSLEIQYEKAHNEATKMYNYQKELLAYLKDHDV